jgi:hypothetical protein
VGGWFGRQIDIYGLIDRSKKRGQTEVESETGKMRWEEKQRNLWDASEIR